MSSNEPLLYLPVRSCLSPIVHKDRQYVASLFRIDLNSKIVYEDRTPKRIVYEKDRSQTKRSFVKIFILNRLKWSLESCCLRIVLKIVTQGSYFFSIFGHYYFYNINYIIKLLYNLYVMLSEVLVTVDFLHKQSKI